MYQWQLLQLPEEQEEHLELPPPLLLPDELKVEKTRCGFLTPHRGQYKFSPLSPIEQSFSKRCPQAVHLNS